MWEPWSAMDPGAVTTVVVSASSTQAASRPGLLVITPPMADRRSGVMESRAAHLALLAEKPSAARRTQPRSSLDGQKGRHETEEFPGPVERDDVAAVRDEMPGE